MSGRLKGEEPFPSIIAQCNLCPSVHHSLLFSFISSFLFLSSFYGVFPYRRVVFPCRWFSRNSGCQHVVVLLKYGCRVRFGFCCYFSAALSQCSFTIIGVFLVGYVPLLALVFLPLQFPVVVLVIFTAATYPTTSLRRLALRALSFASFWPTLSLHHILADPFSGHYRHGVALLNTEEGRVNG